MTQRATIPPNQEKPATERSSQLGRKQIEEALKQALDAGATTLPQQLKYLLALAQLWNLLAGYAGLVSVGQQAWVGIGAYSLLVFSDDVGLPIYASIFLAGLVCAALAYPTALITFRLRGGYFAIGTWVIAEVFRLLVTSNTGLLNGGTGRTLQVRNMFDLEK